LVKLRGGRKLSFEGATRGHFQDEGGVEKNQTKPHPKKKPKTQKKKKAKGCNNRDCRIVCEK